MVKEIVEKYRGKYSGENSYPFPSQLETDPLKKKLKEYLIEQAQAMFSAHMHNRTALSYDSYSYIQELRDYGSGNQSQDKYFNQLSAYDNGSATPQGIDSNGIDTGGGSAQGARRGYDHINKEIVSVAPKIRNMFIGMVEAMEQDIFVNNIDEDSGAEEEFKKNRAFLEAIMYPKYKELQAKMGVDDEMFKPELPTDITLQELDYFHLAGGFKLNYARVMEKLLKYTEKKSNWQETIKKKLTADIVDLNFCAAMCKYDAETQTDTWQYIDPQSLVIQYSKETDFNDAEYGGYYQLETISNLVSKGIDKTMLKKLSKKYTGMFRNPSDDVWEASNESGRTDNWYYDYRVPVFHAYWFDTDVNRRLKVKNKYGKTLNFDLEWDEEVRPITKTQESQGVEKTQYNTHLKKLYQVSWIVDSDVCYDGGEVPFQSRKSKKSPELPIKAWRGVATDDNLKFGSIIEYIRPWLDQIQLNWLRLQNSMARATEDMYAVNLRVLSNLKMGSKELNEYEAFAMGIRSGILPYMDVSFGKRYEGGAVMPVSKIEGTSLEGVSKHMQLINNHIQFIHEFLGISPEQVGGVEQNASVTQSRMAAMGSNNINRTLISGVFTTKKGLADISSRRIQLLCKYNTTAKNAYSRIVGKKDVEVLAEAIRLGVEYGVNLEPRPEAGEKQEIKDMIVAGLQAGREGVSQIEIDQALYIFEQLWGDGNFKEIRLKVMFELKRRKEERERQANQKIMLQGQQNKELAAQQSQGEIQKKQLEVQGKIAVDNNSHKNSLELETLKGNIDYEKELMNKSAEYDAAQEQKQQSV